MNVENLQKALDLIEQERATLDVTYDLCNNCSMKHYHDYEAYKQHDALGAATTRLQRAIEWEERMVKE